MRLIGITLGLIVGFFGVFMVTTAFQNERRQITIINQNARIEANQRAIACNQLQLLLSMNENAELITANQSNIAVGPVRVKHTDHSIQLIRECDNE